MQIHHTLIKVYIIYILLLKDEGRAKKDCKENVCFKQKDIYLAHLSLSRSFCTSEVIMYYKTAF